MADDNDAKYLAGIEKLLGQKLNRRPIEGISGELIRAQRPARRRPAADDEAALATTDSRPGDEPAEPPRRRRRQKAEPALPAEASTDAAVDATAGETKPKRRRRVAKPKAAEPSTDPEAAQVVAEAAPTTDADDGSGVQPPRRPERKPAGRHRDGGRDEPVVGLGDHVPAFLLRPVPVKVSA